GGEGRGEARGGEAEKAQAVPTGSAWAGQPPARPSPNERAENAPRPSRTSGPSADAQSTTDSTGTAAGPAGNLRLPNQSSRHAGAASRRTENQKLDLAG